MCIMETVMIDDKKDLFNAIRTYKNLEEILFVDCDSTFDEPMMFQVQKVASGRYYVRYFDMDAEVTPETSITKDLPDWKTFETPRKALYNFMQCFEN